MTNVEKLKALQYDIKEYADYLENNTYNPYEKVKDFARRLRDIITDFDKDYLNVGTEEEPERITKEEYFDEWFAYGAPEKKTYRMCFEEGINYARLQKEKES
jgi:hypothetical protein